MIKNANRNHQRKKNTAAKSNTVNQSMTENQSQNKKNVKRNTRKKNYKKKKYSSVQTAEDVRIDNEHLEKEIILDIQSIRQIEIE